MRILTAFLLSFVFLCFHGVNQPAQAILVPHSEDNNVLENAPHNCVGRFGNGSMVAISPHYFVTARHVFSTSNIIRINGEEIKWGGLEARVWEPDDTPETPSISTDMRIYRLGLDQDGVQREFNTWCPINDAIPAALANDDVLYKKYDPLYLAGTGWQAGDEIGEGEFEVLQVRSLEMSRATFFKDFHASSRIVTSMYMYSPDIYEGAYSEYVIEGNGNASYHDSGGGILVLDTENAACENGFLKAAGVMTSASGIGSQSNPQFGLHAKTTGFSMAGEVYGWVLGRMTSVGEADHVFMLPPHCEKRVVAGGFQSFGGDGRPKPEGDVDDPKSGSGQSQAPCVLNETQGQFTMRVPGQQTIHLNARNEEESAAMHQLMGGIEESCP